MANFYVTISPIDTLSTSTYSIYFDEVKYSNLMLSNVSQSTLVGGLLVYFTGSAANATSVYVKNEDPDCCCAVKSFIFPTPSPTASPTTAAPTTASPTVAPTTAAPTTAAPTTAAPTTAAPTTSSPTTAAPTTPSPTSGLSYSTTRFRFANTTGDCCIAAASPAYYVPNSSDPIFGIPQYIYQDAAGTIPFPNSFFTDAVIGLPSATHNYNSSTGQVGSYVTSCL
jgi:hypothetical protein